MTQLLSLHENKDTPLVGYTHFVVLSDGDITDRNAAQIVSERMLQSCPHTSLDCAIMSSNNTTQMEGLMTSIRGGKHNATVGVARAMKPQELLEALEELLTSRMLGVPAHSYAVPASDKQREFRRALQRMNDGQSHDSGYSI